MDQNLPLPLCPAFRTKYSSEAAIFPVSRIFVQLSGQTPRLFPIFFRRVCSALLRRPIACRFVTTSSLTKNGLRQQMT